MEIVFINFLIQKDFLNTCSRQSFFPLTNQNAHLITKNQSNFALQKSNLSCGYRQRASESRVNERNISFQSS